MALKYGITGINFIPQRPKERLSLAKLAIGDHKELELQKFVHETNQINSLGFCHNSNSFPVYLKVQEIFRILTKDA